MRDVTEQRFRPISAGTLTVATTLPAPGFWEGTDASTVHGGYEWAIADALASRFGLTLRVVDVPFARIVAGDFAGADLAIAQISITNARGDALDFSTPYYDVGPGVLARDGTTLTALKNAREKTWAVVGGTTDQSFLDDVVRPDSAPLVLADDQACADAVADGRVDAALIDLPSALVLAQRDPALDVVARFATDERYGIALPNDSDNVEVVDAALRALQSDGSLRDFASTWLDAAFGRKPADVPEIEART